MLRGPLVRLEPLSPAVLADYLRGLDDPEVTRFTGTHATFGRDEVADWLATRAQQHDRADWAVVRVADGAFLGEAVLNDLDVDNRSVGYRVWLAGTQARGRGYGTEVTRLVVDHALDTCGLHRVSLEVFAFNPRAQRVYEKCGFRVEGRLRDALHWDGEWHDTLVMAVLSTDRRASSAATFGDAALAATPRPPYTAVVFTSVRAPDDDAGYAEMARLMDELAAAQPGYLGVESARDGVGITVSYWVDDAAARAWKQVAEHLVAQQRGRQAWYSDYRVRVATVHRDYGPDTDRSGR